MKERRGGVCRRIRRVKRTEWNQSGAEWKEEQRRRLGGQGGEERWRVCLIYVAGVADNRKVKGYSRGIKGRRREETKRTRQSGGALEQRAGGGMSEEGGRLSEARYSVTRTLSLRAGLLKSPDPHKLQCGPAEDVINTGAGRIYHSRSC